MPRVPRLFVVIDTTTGVVHHVRAEDTPPSPDDYATPVRQPGDAICGASFFWATVAVTLTLTTRYFRAQISSPKQTPVTCLGCLGTLEDSE